MLPDHRPSRLTTVSVIAALCLLVSLPGCQHDKEFIRQHKILAFGTIIDVTIRHHDLQTINTAFKRLEKDFLEMHRLWHPWNPGPVSRANQLLRTGEWFLIAPSILPIVRESKRLSLLSNGYFNPAIGELVALWGFHRDDPTSIPEINESEIERVKSNLPSMTHVEIKGIKARGHNPNIKIDLGGIAKGFGLEQAMDTLQQMGIKHALLNAGGDLCVIGTHVGRPWKVGVQHPRSAKILASLEMLENESVFTSGDYQRYYQNNGKRRHHVIDPLTGEPVDHSQAVTVVHANATIADAAATALLVAGPDHWQQVARQMGIKDVLLMDAKGNLHVTTSMQKRIKLTGNPKLIITSLDQKSID